MVPQKSEWAEAPAHLPGVSPHTFAGGIFPPFRLSTGGGRYSILRVEPIWRDMERFRSWVCPLVCIVMLASSCSRKPTIENLGEDLSLAVQHHDKDAVAHLYHAKLRHCIEPRLGFLDTLPSDPSTVEIRESADPGVSQARSLVVPQKWVIVLNWEAAHRHEEFPAGDYEGRPALLADCTIPN
jgi:hypothetical protein